MDPAARQDATFGLRLPNGGFITYTFARPEEAPQGPETLVVTYVQHPVPFAALVAAARREKCPSIEIWGGFTGWDNEAGGAFLQPYEQSGSIPALAEYGFGGNDKVEWEWVEK